MTYDPGPPPELHRKNITPYIWSIFGVFFIVWIVDVRLRVLVLLAAVVTVFVAKYIRDREAQVYRNAYDDWARAAWAQWYAENPAAADEAQAKSTPAYGNAGGVRSEPNWYGPQSAPGRVPSSGWSTAGTVVAVIAAIGGLVIMATVVLFVVALSNSNTKLGNK